MLEINYQDVKNHDKTVEETYLTKKSKMMKKIISIIKSLKELVYYIFQQNKTTNRLKDLGIDIEKPINILNINKLKVTPPIYIGPNANLYLRAELHIGSGTIIGPNLTVHTANHQYEGHAVPYDDIYIGKNVIIEENVWIGANVTILPGIKIGRGAIIGACSVITKDIPEFAIVAGNPAKIVKFRDIERYHENVKSGKVYLDLKRKGLTETNEEKRLKIID